MPQQSRRMHGRTAPTASSTARSGLGAQAPQLDVAAALGARIGGAKSGRRSAEVALAYACPSGATLRLSKAKNSSSIDS